MHWVESFDRFQFNYYLFFHQQIKSVAGRERKPAVNQRQCFLLFNSKTAKRQLMQHTDLISRFQEPRSQLAVHRDGRANNLFSN